MTGMIIVVGCSIEWGNAPDQCVVLQIVVLTAVVTIIEGLIAEAAVKRQNANGSPGKQSNANNNNANSGAGNQRSK